MIAGYARWHSCDDSTVRGLTEKSVTSPTDSHTPYILFYRRRDTIIV